MHFPEDGHCTETATRVVIHLLKSRARYYARRPIALDALHPHLSSAPAERLVAVAQHLVEREERSPRRWFGFGGEVSLLNTKAALLLGRAQRRAQRRQQAAQSSRRRPSRPAATTQT